MKSVIAALVLLSGLTAHASFAELSGRIDCKGQFRPDILIRVTGNIDPVGPGSVLKRSVTGKLKVVLTVIGNGSSNILVTDEQKVSGTYLNHGPVNGGEVLTIVPAERGAYTKIIRSRFFENGHGPRYTNTLQLHNPMAPEQGETVSLECGHGSGGASAR